MKQFLLILFLALFAMAQTKPGMAQKGSDCPGKDITLDQFQWDNRILVIFAADSTSEFYQRQMNEFSSLGDELLDRDLILISIFDDGCATLGNRIISDSSAADIRKQLSPTAEEYSVFLIGKDGGVKLKQDKFLAPDELFSVIDRMPMRRREMRDGG